ncbi:MAG: glycoside hydrolase [Candidatus Korobacteraceae bacterium]|jgi:photosystem II stability/assembly factor-like uncharacterized protein
MSLSLAPRRPHLRPILLLLFIALLPLTLICQQQPDANLFSGMRWRLIGPFRGGRVTSVAGVPGDPNAYYFGTPGGGVWKTTDGGRVWHPIFDNVRVASIGALAVAPSAANIIYVGTGEQTPGRGLYRSSDSGKTWNSVGLEDVQYIQVIIVDPQNPDIVVVAANSVGVGIFWQPLATSAWTADRGIFRTEDGGKSWKKVYANDATIGVVDMCSDPDNSRVLYAVVYRPASGSAASEMAGTSDIVKSSDEGSTWAPLEGKGLPDKARGRLGITVASGTGGQRLYAILDQGLFRSDDGGANWYQSSKDPRVIGSLYFSRVFADPLNPDVLYVAQTSLYRSTDGGKTFEAYVGAPSGDDFHVLWIDPQNSARMILGVDQGAIVSVDAGKTWTSWYNQPTGQFYHVSTDNLFPYRVYGAQQDSGTAGVLSRSDYGEILLQDWYSIGGFEYAYIAPDPANPDFVYSNGWYDSVVRFDKSTGEITTVFERGQKYRAGSMPPLVFSPQDPSVLYLGMQSVLKTSDGGRSWQEISSDLTGYVEKEVKEGEKPPPGQEHPPAITSLSPSPVQAGEIWAGTTNRLVQLTRDAGATWQNVAPAGLAEHTNILYVEASHHDPATAYLTVGGTRESTPPAIFRTHDYGHTWQKIVNGFPPDEMVRVVREDPKRKGLLYAGTDTSVFVSWDDGEHWQSLALNLPPTPITDLTVHGNDLAISTFGRGLWMLDDVTPIREIDTKITAANVYLFPPANGMRVRWDNYQDTPYPPETPAGQNPPDGAIIDYLLKNAASSELTLSIFDENNNQVAQFTSEPKPINLPPANAPEYWFAPPAALTKSAGVNRFAWDLRYAPPLTLPYGYYGNLLGYTEYTLADHAVPGLTPRLQPQGPLVVPGKYTVELRYAGQTLRHPLTIELDPRVRASQSDLEAQRDLALDASRGMKASFDAYHQVAGLRAALAERKKSISSDKLKKLKEAVDALDRKIDATQNGTRTAPGFGPINRDLARLIFSVESADMGPADTVRAAVQQTCDALDKALALWSQLNAQDIPAFNATHAGDKVPALPVTAVSMSGCKL